MSLTSLENTIESIEVLMLQGQTALSGFSIVREMEDSAANKDRIVVKCAPRQPFLLGQNQGTPVSWLFPVTVTVLLATRSTANFDTVIAAIEAANASGASIPSAATTLANAQFSRGLTIEPTQDGDVDHGENVRNRSKTFNFISIV